MYPRLQPYVPQAATLCILSCNPMYPGLQPYVYGTARLLAPPAAWKSSKARMGVG